MTKEQPAAIPDELMRKVLAIAVKQYQSCACPDLSPWPGTGDGPPCMHERAVADIRRAAIQYRHAGQSPFAEALREFCAGWVDWQESGRLLEQRMSTAAAHADSLLAAYDRELAALNALLEGEKSNPV